MKIETALDWQTVGNELLKNVKSIGYNPDLHKMYKNIEHMVSELSKLEVDYRRIHKTEHLSSKVDSINKAIDHLNKFIIMAKLMQ